MALRLLVKLGLVSSSIFLFGCDNEEKNEEDDSGESSSEDGEAPQNQNESPGNGVVVEGQGNAAHQNQNEGNAANQNQEEAEPDYEMSLSGKTWRDGKKLPGRGNQNVPYKKNPAIDSEGKRRVHWKSNDKLAKKREIYPEEVPLEPAQWAQLKSWHILVIIPNKLPADHFLKFHEGQFINGIKWDEGETFILLRTIAELKAQLAKPENQDKKCFIRVTQNRGRGTTTTPKTPEQISSKSRTEAQAREMTAAKRKEDINMMPDGSALGMTDAELDFFADIGIKFRDWAANRLLVERPDLQRKLDAYHGKADEAKKEWRPLFDKFKAKIVEQRELHENYGDRDEEPPDEYEVFVKKHHELMLKGMRAYQLKMFMAQLARANSGANSGTGGTPTPSGGNTGGTNPSSFAQVHKLSDGGVRGMKRSSAVAF